MGVARINIWSFFFILVSILSISTSDRDDCEYTVNVQTGTVLFAGTDSTISLTLYDAFGNKLSIDNLERWGQMGPNHDYFQNGNLDTFRKEARCLAGPVCAIKLTSDNTGFNSGWYCAFVEVSTCRLEATTTGLQKKCTEKFFTIEQWLSTISPPYSLTAFRDKCSSFKNKYLNVKDSKFNAEGSSDDKKDMNVEGSGSSNVAAQ